MRTTIDIPDDLFKAAKLHAVQVETTLRELVIEGLKSQLQKSAVPREHIQFPILHSKNPGTLDLTNEQIDDLIEFP